MLPYPLSGNSEQSPPLLPDAHEIEAVAMGADVVERGAAFLETRKLQPTRETSTRLRHRMGTGRKLGDAIIPSGLEQAAEDRELGVADLRLRSPSGW